MKCKILNKIIALIVISIAFLAILPNSLGMEITYYKEKPVNNGDIEFKVWGFMAFFVKVTNNRDTPVVAYVNFTMQFFDLGAKSIINPFPVNAHSSAVIFWDCQPMPIYFTTITITAGGENYTKNGFTLLGFNIFFT
ncbi:MAG: hypothetical protein FK731_11640 [Asgard group archaeon]|nr:hypothetical protein [Asgard group archaeon]